MAEILALDDSPVLIRAHTGRVHSHSSGEVLSILTYPMPDYAGDYVRPDGGDWDSKFPSIYGGRMVNWTHGVPIGRGAVELKALQYQDKTTRVAVGKTAFAQCKADLDGLDLRRRDPRTNRPWDKEAPYSVDECLEAATQAHRLVDDDVANGVSIEFEAGPQFPGTKCWDLPNKSLLENRPAKHFENWTALAYAHARSPVNAGCTTLLAGDSEAIEKAIRVAQTGKLPGGEVCCPVIYKAFADLKGLSLSPNGRTSVHVQSEVPAHAKAKGESASCHSMSESAHAMTGELHRSVGSNKTRVAHEFSKAAVEMSSNGQHDMAGMHHEASASHLMDHANSDGAKMSEESKAAASSHQEAAAAHRTRYVETKAVIPNQTAAIIKAEDEGDGESPSMGVQAFMNAVQGLQDICSALEEDASQSDDLQLRKFAKKMCEKLEAMAGDLQARAEKKHGELKGGGKKDEDDDSWDDEDAEHTAEEKAITLNPDDGRVVFKSFPEWKARRYSIKNLAPISAADAAAEQKALDDQWEAAQKRARKARKALKPLLDAAEANADRIAAVTA